MTLDDFLRALVQAVDGGAIGIDGRLVILRRVPAADPGAVPGWDVSPVVDVMMNETGDHAVFVPGDDSTVPLTIGGAIVLIEGFGESARSSQVMARWSSAARDWDIHLDEPVVGGARNRETASYGAVVYFEGFEDVLGSSAAV